MKNKMLGEQTRDLVWWHVDKQAKRQVAWQFLRHVDWPIDWKIRQQVEDRVRQQVRQQVWRQVWWQARQRVWMQAWDQLENDYDE